MMYEFLGKGFQSALTLGELAEMTGDTPQRVRDELEREQSQRFPVLSNYGFGVFYAPSDGEAGVRERESYNGVMRMQHDICRALLKANAAVAEAEKLFLQYIGRCPENL